MTTARVTVTEPDVRVAWWLREYGHFPTREALLAIAKHRRIELSVAS